MKITKLVHSCLLIETPERVGLIDPGNFSAQAITNLSLSRLDDILITHEHGDHMDIDIIKDLLSEFPAVNIIAPDEAAQKLQAAGIETATDKLIDGVETFDSPHESVAPLFGQPPQEYGYHYLDKLSHPGDSHSFSETKAILALPVSAPWGSTIKAINLGLELKPKYVIPIHDWHWNDQARASLYDKMAVAFEDNGINFIKPDNGQAFEIDV
ncbi:MAG TPA: MBL fold metallo-hydrolase [Candidatus Saccharimonadales bacterium]|nr:MBL fold metallo-hydrolase [Candidatus Saccharimonadales bacterium]